MRKQAAAPAKSASEFSIPDVDYLDIPAFLRRQEEQVE
jgi:cell division protein FtsZ